MPRRGQLQRREIISILAPSAKDKNRTGKPYSSSTGLYYYFQRWYDPSIGRFISQDDIVGFRSDPQSFNRYLYARDTPMTLTDPSGMIAVPRSVCDHCYSSQNSECEQSYQSVSAFFSSWWHSFTNLECWGGPGGYSASSLGAPTFQTRKQTLQSRCLAVVSNQHAVSRHDHILVTNTTLLSRRNNLSLHRVKYYYRSGMIPYGIERNSHNESQNICHRNSHYDARSHSVLAPCPWD